MVLATVKFGDWDRERHVTGVPSIRTATVSLGWRVDAGSSKMRRGAIGAAAGGSNGIGNSPSVKSSVASVGNSLGWGGKARGGRQWVWQTLWFEFLDVPDFS